MAQRGYKEWAKHLRPKGKRAAAKQARVRDKHLLSCEHKRLLSEVK